MLQMIDLEITESVLLYHCLWAQVLFVVFAVVSQCVLDLRIRIEQFADGMIIVQLVDHECNVLAQVYIDVVWTG